jgi:4-oxalocrotonate tautomerase
LAKLAKILLNEYIDLINFKKSGNKEEIMPYVNIRVAGTLSKQQKQEICSGVTDVIARVANKPKDSILIFIDEDQHENISKGGKLLQKPA